MKNPVALTGLMITALSIIVGAAMAYQHLIDRVDALEKRERFEHGSYTLPEGVR